LAVDELLLQQGTDWMLILLHIGHYAQ